MSSPTSITLQGQVSLGTTDQLAEQRRADASPRSSQARDLTSQQQAHARPGRWRVPPAGGFLDFNPDGDHPPAVAYAEEFTDEAVVPEPRPRRAGVAPCTTASLGPQAAKLDGQRDAVGQYRVRPCSPMTQAGKEAQGRPSAPPEISYKLVYRQ